MSELISHVASTLAESKSCTGQLSHWKHWHLVSNATVLLNGIQHLYDAKFPEEVEGD